MYTDYRGVRVQEGGELRVRGIDRQPWFHQIPTENLLLQGTDNRIWGVSWNDLGVVEHVELFCSVTAGIEHDSLLSSWVVWQEGSDIEDLTVNDDPSVVLRRVLGNLVEGEDLSASV